MARTLGRTSRLPVEPDALVTVLTDEAFLIARHTGETAASATVPERRRDGDRLTIGVEADEYARTLTGVDRSRTERARITYTWDVRRRSCAWRWRGAQGARVGIEGTMRVRPPAGGGGGSEIESEFTVEVRLPLIGGAIERRILAEIVAGLPRLEDLILSFARPRRAG